MDIKTIHIAYSKDNLRKSASFKTPGFRFFNEDFGIELAENPLDPGSITSVLLSVKGRLVLESFSITAAVGPDYERMLINGFQSWTTSVESGRNARFKRLNPLAASLLTPYGDYSFDACRIKRDELYSFSFTCLSSKGRECFFLGSLDESSGYTIFKSNLANGYMEIVKDCEGLIPEDNCKLLEIFADMGEEKALWERYFNCFNSSRKPVGQCTGWTSWYNYYTHISEEIVIKNLDSIAGNNIPVDVFQIDDGYQSAVGDWLNISSKFPRGMKYIADNIKKAGFRPGIWLAPFVCGKNSEIFREHDNWLLKDNRGRLVKAGWNPNWGGTFYALDIYNKEFRAYLRKVFDTVLNEWGYSMVKLDFLYGAAIIPSGGKPRGRIMCDAMDLLDELIGDNCILGCGAPLAPSFKKVDYCRIGSDVAPYWEDRKLSFLNYRERVSTLNSLHSTLARFRLNGRTFVNDPDVFFLRSENNKMNTEQTNTLFILNNLLGGLVFFSDYVGSYDAARMKMLKSMFPKQNPDIEYLKQDNDVYEIKFSIGQRNYMLFTNLNSHFADIILEEGLYYDYVDSITVVPDKKSITLKPYQTRCFHIAGKSGEVVPIGSTGYIFPCGEIRDIHVSAGHIDISLAEGFMNNTDIVLSTPNGCKTATVNGKAVNLTSDGGCTYVSHRNDIHC